VTVALAIGAGVSVANVTSALPAAPNVESAVLEQQLDVLLADTLGPGEASARRRGSTEPGEVGARVPVLDEPRVASRVTVVR
jgi:hypothetical protein